MPHDRYSAPQGGNYSSDEDNQGFNNGWNVKPSPSSDSSDSSCGGKAKDRYGVDYDSSDGEVPMVTPNRPPKRQQQQSVANRTTRSIHTERSRPPPRRHHPLERAAEPAISSTRRSTRNAPKRVDFSHDRRRGRGSNDESDSSNSDYSSSDSDSSSEYTYYSSDSETDEPSSFWSQVLPWSSPPSPPRQTTPASTPERRTQEQETEDEEEITTPVRGGSTPVKGVTTVTPVRAGCTTILCSSESIAKELKGDADDSTIGTLNTLDTSHRDRALSMSPLDEAEEFELTIDDVFPTFTQDDLDSTHDDSNYDDENENPVLVDDHSSVQVSFDEMCHGDFEPPRSPPKQLKVSSDDLFSEEKKAAVLMSALDFLPDKEMATSSGSQGSTTSLSNNNDDSMLVDDYDASDDVTQSDGISSTELDSEPISSPHKHVSFRIGHHDKERSLDDFLQEDSNSEDHIKENNSKEEGVTPAVKAETTAAFSMSLSSSLEREDETIDTSVQLPKEENKVTAEESTPNQDSPTRFSFYESSYVSSSSSSSLSTSSAAPNHAKTKAAKRDIEDNDIDDGSRGISYVNLDDKDDIKIISNDEDVAMEGSGLRENTPCPTKEQPEEINAVEAKESDMYDGLVEPSSLEEEIVGDDTTPLIMSYEASDHLIEDDATDGVAVYGDANERRMNEISNRQEDQDMFHAFIATESDHLPRSETSTGTVLDDADIRGVRDIADEQEDQVDAQEDSAIESDWDHNAVMGVSPSMSFGSDGSSECIDRYALTHYDTIQCSDTSNNGVPGMAEKILTEDSHSDDPTHEDKHGMSVGEPAEIASGEKSFGNEPTESLYHTEDEPDLNNCSEEVTADVCNEENKKEDCEKVGADNFSMEEIVDTSGSSGMEDKHGISVGEETAETASGNGFLGNELTKSAYHTEVEPDLNACSEEETSDACIEENKIEVCEKLGATNSSEEEAPDANNEENKIEVCEKLRAADSSEEEAPDANNEENKIEVGEKVGVDEFLMEETVNTNGSSGMVQSRLTNEDCSHQGHTVLVEDAHELRNLAEGEIMNQCTDDDTKSISREFESSDCSSIIANQTPEQKQNDTSSVAMSDTSLAEDELSGLPASLSPHPAAQDSGRKIQGEDLVGILQEKEGIPKHVESDVNDFSKNVDLSAESVEIVAAEERITRSSPGEEDSPLHLSGASGQQAVEQAENNAGGDFTQADVASSTELRADGVSRSVDHTSLDEVINASSQNSEGSDLSAVIHAALQDESTSWTEEALKNSNDDDDYMDQILNVASSMGDESHHSRDNSGHLIDREPNTNSYALYVAPKEAASHNPEIIADEQNDGVKGDGSVDDDICKDQILHDISDSDVPTNCEHSSGLDNNEMVIEGEDITDPLDLDKNNTEAITPHIEAIDTENQNDDKRGDGIAGDGVHREQTSVVPSANDREAMTKHEMVTSSRELSLPIVAAEIDKQNDGGTEEQLPPTPTSGAMKVLLMLRQAANAEKSTPQEGVGSKRNEFTSPMIEKQSTHEGSCDNIIIGVERDQKIESNVHTGAISEDAISNSSSHQGSSDSVYSSEVAADCNNGYGMDTEEIDTSKGDSIRLDEKETSCELEAIANKEAGCLGTTAIPDSKVLAASIHGDKFGNNDGGETGCLDLGAVLVCEAPTSLTVDSNPDLLGDKVEASSIETNSCEETYDTTNTRQDEISHANAMTDLHHANSGKVSKPEILDGQSQQSTSTPKDSAATEDSVLVTSRGSKIEDSVAGEIVSSVPNEPSTGWSVSEKENTSVENANLLEKGSKSKQASKCDVESNREDLNAKDLSDGPIIQAMPNPSEVVPVGASKDAGSVSSQSNATSTDESISEKENKPVEAVNPPGKGSKTDQSSKCEVEGNGEDLNTKDPSDESMARAMPHPAEVVPGDTPKEKSDSPAEKEADLVVIAPEENRSVLDELSELKARMSKRFVSPGLSPTSASKNSSAEVTSEESRTRMSKLYGSPTGGASKKSLANSSGEKLLAANNQLRSPASQSRPKSRTKTRSPSANASGTSPMAVKKEESQLTGERSSAVKSQLRSPASQSRPESRTKTRSPSTNASVVVKKEESRVVDELSELKARMSKRYVKEESQLTGERSSVANNQLRSPASQSRPKSRTKTRSPSANASGTSPMAVKKEESRVVDELSELKARMSKRYVSSGVGLSSTKVASNKSTEKKTREKSLVANKQLRSPAAPTRPKPTSRKNTSISLTERQFGHDVELSSAAVLEVLKQTKNTLQASASQT